MIEYQYNVVKNVQIINEIIEIETAAQELIKNARREQDELPEKTSVILDEYKSRQYKKAGAKIEQVRTAEEKSAKAKIDKINKDHAEKLGRLKKAVDENIDSWVKKIYSFIVNPTDIL